MQIPIDPTTACNSFWLWASKELLGVNQVCASLFGCELTHKVAGFMSHGIPPAFAFQRFWVPWPTMLNTSSAVELGRRRSGSTPCIWVLEPVGAGRLSRGSWLLSGGPLTLKGCEALLRSQATPVVLARLQNLESHRHKSIAAQLPVWWAAVSGSLYIA